MKNDTRDLGGFTVLTVVLACIALQAVFTLTAYGDGIVAWGDNQFGQATPPTGNDFTAVAAGVWHNIALKSDGSIVGWGINNSGEATLPDEYKEYDFTAIAAGYAYSLALKSDGSIVGWGSNSSGRATPPAGNDYVAISAGNFHGLALKADGSIVGWGLNIYSQATPPAGNDYVAIATGAHHSIALKADGSIVGWGWNNYGQAKPPAGNDFTAIAAHLYHSLALKADGSIVGWGWNNHDQLTPPAGNDYVAIATGERYSLALKSDGSIVGWGDNVYAPSGNNFTAVAAGELHSLALKTENTPPVADAGGPYLVAVDQSIVLNGSGSTHPDGDPLSYFWNQEEDLGDFDDDTLESPSFTGVTAGVTNLELWVGDGIDIALDSTMLVVYDPSGGFVTGGGWIDSPAGAYADDLSLVGVASFGFVSKYKKGAQVPTGNTEFVFQSGDLTFHSSSYDWLVVTGSDYARFKGAGTVNGDGPYKFMLWARDGGKDDYDTFRIKIWEEDETTGDETVIYDNDTDQPISGGSIVVHAK